MKRASLAGCLLVSTSLAGGAWATTANAEVANAATPGATEVGEVIVTAQKRSERLSDVPISITALSADQLARRGITGPADLQKAVPGFTFAESSYGAPIYTIRGIGFYSESIDVSPAVSVYVDQVPLAFSRMTEGVGLDLERVEVLKGPQGTLFGQNSTGGAINYIAAKPTSAFAAGADLTYGRYNQIDASAFVSGPINETVSARLAFRTEHRDGWQDDYAGLTNSAAQAKNGVRDFNVGRLLIDWRPTDRLNVEFNVNGWVDHSDAQAKQKIAYAPLVPGGFAGTPQFPNIQAQLAAFPNAPRNNTAAAFYPGISHQRDDSFFQVSTRADLSLTSKITLSSITSYSHLKVFNPFDGSGTIYPDQYGVVTGSISSYSQELRLAGTALPNDALNWLVGANYEHDKTANDHHININGTNSGFGPFRFTAFRLVNDNRIKTAAAFGNVEYKLTDTLTVQGALRYTRRSDDFSGCGFDAGDGAAAAAISFLSSQLSGSPQVIAPGGCTTLSDNFTPLSLTKLKLDEDNLSYRGGLSWKVRPTLLLYANVTKGYKAGAFETLPAIIVSEFAPARQESVLAYEVGFKSFFFDRTLGVDGAAFYYDYRNKQLQGYINEPIFGTLPALISIPKSRVKGAELGIFWKPNGALTLNAGGTYIDSAVTEPYVVAGAFGGNIDINDSPFPFTPKWQITSDAEYDFPVSSTLTGYVGGGVTYHSATIAAFAGGPLLNIADYTLLDLRAGLRGPDDKWRVEVWGHNVTDQYYWQSVEHLEDTVARTTGMPATFGITISGRY